jgi:hypothetical protein
MPELSTSDKVGGGSRIELRHDLEAAYWCRVFDVTPSELRRAIQKVGPQVSAVRRHLEHGREGPRWVEDSGF